MNEKLVRHTSKFNFSPYSPSISTPLSFSQSQSLPRSTICANFTLPIPSCHILFMFSFLFFSHMPFVPYLYCKFSRVEFSAPTYTHSSIPFLLRINFSTKGPSTMIGWASSPCRRTHTNDHVVSPGSKFQFTLCALIC